MEKVAQTNQEGAIASQEIINSFLVIKNLHQHSLKEVLADYSDRQTIWRITPRTNWG
ncbi:hypothetical protein IQ255_28975 [Pleurocapsales cyanobacterium LEGE 10410]|nr:hypothetical protein [Pleurocapsales cyanobacterium LEGE 10410]